MSNRARSDRTQSRRTVASPKTAQPSLLAIDVGQTGMRGATAEGTVEVEGGVSALTDASRIRELAERIIDVARRVGVQPAVVSIGLSGYVTDSSAPRKLGEQIRSRLGARTVAVAADVVTAYLGTIGGRAGVAAICGTGVAALGADGEARWKRIDARGYLLGDFGSGFWIGQRGLQAALDAAEARGPMTTLVAASLRLGSSERIYHDAMASVPPARYVASFAPDVLVAAEGGDRVALSIVDEAAVQITRSVAAADLDGGPVGFTGGLLRSPLFADALRSRLAGREVVVEPDAALVGARLLGQEFRRIAMAFPGLVDVVESDSRTDASEAEA